MAVNVTGAVSLPNGTLYTQSSIKVTRQGGVVPLGGAVLLPDVFVITTDISGEVDFYAEPGSYIGQASSNAGRITWEFSVPDVASVLFSECLTTVAERVYTQTELDVLVGAGMQTFTDTAEGLAKTTNGKFFMVPAAPMGLAIYENVSGVATVRGGLLTQSLLSDGSAAAPSLAFASDTNTGLYRVAADQLGFSTGGTQRALLNSTGLGIGVAAPSAKIHANDDTADCKIRTGGGGAVTDEHGFEIARAGNVIGSFTAFAYTGENRHAAGYSGWGGFHTFRTNGAERMRIDAAGNVLIGMTTLPGEAVNSGVGIRNNNGGQVSIAKTYSGTQFSMPHYHNNVYVGGVSFDDTSVAYNTTSDRDLKKNVEPAPDAGGIIDAIQVVSHDWKADDSHVTHGVIAQDLHEVFPRAVTPGDGAERPWSVDYSKMVPLLIKEIQELRARVAALEGGAA